MKNLMFTMMLLGLMSPLLAGVPRTAADISGTWIFSVDLASGGHGDPTFVFKQEGEKLSGTYSGPLGEQKVSGAVNGDKAVFGFETSQNGETIKATYTGTVESRTKMSGTVQFNDNDERGKWTASRKP